MNKLFLLNKNIILRKHKLTTLFHQAMDTSKLALPIQMVKTIQQ